MSSRKLHPLMADCFCSTQREDGALKQWFWRSLALVLVLGMAGHAGADPGYDFTTIDVPGAETTAALGINDSGLIVGFFRDATGTHGFLRRAGILFPIYTTIDVPGATVTIARGINSSGQIVGDYFDGSKSHGFLLSGGTFTTLDVPGATSTLASGINNSGQIVGEYGSDEIPDEGYLLSNGVYTTITVPGAARTTPRGINIPGHIVGTYNVGFELHGFLLVDGTFTTIDVPGATSTFVYGINTSGRMVGDYVLTSTTDMGTFSVGHGFLRGPGRLFPIYMTIDPPGSTYTAATGINKWGEIVGLYLDGQFAEHGFLATPVK